MTLPFSGFQLFRLFLPVCLALLVKFITVYFTRSFITNGMIFRIIACSSGAAQGNRPRVQFSPDVPSSGITHNLAPEAVPLIG